MDALMVEMSKKYNILSSKFAGKGTGAKCMLMGSEVSCFFVEIKLAAADEKGSGDKGLLLFWSLLR